MMKSSIFPISSFCSVDHFVPKKLTDAMAVGHGDDIDCNDVNALSNRREVRRKQQHCRQGHRVSKLERNFHRTLLSLMRLVADAERGYTPIRRTSLTGVHAA
jgi:hypothetical protein